MAHVASKLYPKGGEALQEWARETGDHALQKAQQTYFDAPGLDSLTIRQAKWLGRGVSHLGAVYLRVKIALGLDRTGRASRNLTLIPRTGYDALMVGGLMAGRTLGYFVRGEMRHALWSANSGSGTKDKRRHEGEDEGATWKPLAGDEPSSAERPHLPNGHPKPAIRRYGAPTTLGDVAADIDDMYWAEAYGQPLKVIRSGEGEQRRWAVIIPGTDHMDYDTQPNPADLETNMEEELNITSDLRVGVINVVKDAMRREGLSEEEMVSERVLAAGHSLGGMVAAALASADPREVGFTVDTVFTMGSPTRRLILRRDVAMVAVEHDQDVIPAFDGAPRRDVDQRITYTRRLTRPAFDPLFYAHSSATYTETVRRMEERLEIVPYGRLAQAVSALQGMLPTKEEVGEAKVFHYYVWRDVINVGEPPETQEFPTLDVGRPEGWKPVSFEGDVTLNEKSTQLLIERVGRGRRD